MQTEAESGGKKRSSDDDFRLGVLAADSGHHPATCFRTDDIGHLHHPGSGLAQLRAVAVSGQVSDREIARIRVLNGATDDATI